MSRHHRRRAQTEGNFKDVCPMTVTTNGAMLPTSPEMSRPLDAEVIVAVQWLDQLLNEIRDAVKAQPIGEIAQTVLEFCDSVEIYGTRPPWGAFVQSLQATHQRTDQEAESTRGRWR